MYKRTEWVDHIVSPTGEVIQEGTPISAANLNNIEEGIEKLSQDIGNVEIPLATLQEPGIVQLSNATDSVDETKAATPKAIHDVNQALSTHAEDAGLHVTAQKQQTWDAKETTAGAQAKANQAEMNAKNYVNGLAWQKSAVTDASGNAILISSQDLNVDRPTGWYRGSGMANAPSSDWHYVENIRHDPSWSSQRAINYNNGKESMRVKSNGVWSAWKGVGDVLYKKPRVAVFNATLQDKVWTEVLTVNGSGRINHIAANASTGNIFVHLSITIDGVTQILEDRVNSGGNQLLGLYRDSGISGSAATDIFPNVSFESNFSLKIMQDTGSLRSTTVFVDYALV